jgi:hypothetical protein
VCLCEVVDNHGNGGTLERCHRCSWPNPNRRNTCSFPTGTTWARTRLTKAGVARYSGVVADSRGSAGELLQRSEGGGSARYEPGLLGTLASLLTREGRLVSYFNVLKEGGQRDTPAVVLKGEEGFVEVLAAPTEQQDGWLLGDGRLKSTRDILELDTMRALAGYS